MKNQDTLSLLLGHSVPVIDPVETHRLVSRQIMVTMSSYDYSEVVEFKKRLLALESKFAYYDTESIFCQLFTAILNIALVDMVFYQWAIQFYSQDDVSNEIQFLTQGYYDTLDDIQEGLAATDDEVDENLPELLYEIQDVVTEFMLESQFINHEVVGALVDQMDYFPVLAHQCEKGNDHSHIGEQEFLVNPVEVMQVDLRRGMILITYETFDPAGDFSVFHPIRPQHHQGLRQWYIKRNH